MTNTSMRVTGFDQLPNAALLSASDLVTLSGRSRTSVWRDVNEGRLCKPVRLGPNCVRWRVSDVRKYLAGEYTAHPVDRTRSSASDHAHK
jgi:predicted DNA-binding transcriptional regulator AlpA